MVEMEEERLRMREHVMNEVMQEARSLSFWQGLTLLNIINNTFPQQGQQVLLLS